MCGRTELPCKTRPRGGGSSRPAGPRGAGDGGPALPQAGRIRPCPRCSGPESRGNRSAPQAPLLVASRACQRPSHRGDGCGSLLGPGSAVPRKESRVEMHPPPAQPPGWAPDPVTKGLTPRKGRGCVGPPRAPPPPRLFLSHSLRLSRAPHGPGLCPLLCFPSLLTGLDRNAGLAASGVLSGSAPDTRTGEASRVWRHSPMTRADTNCRAPVGTRERQRTPARARPPSLRDGAPRAACRRATTRCSPGPLL